MEEKQGMEIEGRAIILDYTGEKSQQDGRKMNKGAYSGDREARPGLTWWGGARTIGTARAMP